MTSLEFAEEQIRLTRAYTHSVLDHTEPAHWFEMPPGCPTHIAWQVGHLAMAQFRLGIQFMREVTPADEAVLSAGFMAPFRRGTQPVADMSAYPSTDEIRNTFDRMHDHLLAELPKYAEVDLNTPTRIASPIVKTKSEALTWLARHEMTHTGQISLIRRLLGAPSYW